ncbi:MAG: response regulator [Pirellulales bacterium]|nr:response regulator [Pirellulales bacterium]
MNPIVLLVDDDENVLHGLSRVLRNQPYHLFTARSGDEAIHVLKTHVVDVIVADDQMPGMSGSDLLAWVAEHCSEVRRIVLTGHATAATAIRAINEGAVFRFFTKPCDEVELAIAIREALEQRQAEARAT